MSKVVLTKQPGRMTLRGAGLEAYRYKGHEWILSGSAESGKTMACLFKLHMLSLKFPGSQSLIARKVRNDLTGAALTTYQSKIVRNNPAIVAYGGESPQWFDYPNGSRIYVGGLDKASKVLSSERDYIYVNQCEELTLEDWETLLTRCTGRAGNVPWSQLFGDCNPGPPSHWIKHRQTLRVFEARHEDNPTLFDDDGKITEQGKRTISILDTLTGVRKERLRYGRWVSAEGIVYEGFDEAVHLIDAFTIPSSWPKFRAIDFGFTNPFVCLFGAIDPDGRLFIYRQWYRTQMTVRDHATKIKDLTGDEKIEATIADHDAEDRATLHQCGIPTIPAKKEISVGIQAVQERLRVQPDGKPRLFIMRGSLVERDEALHAARQPIDIVDEFGSYAWPKDSSGRAMKEVPVDLHNHANDCARYLIQYLDNRSAVPHTRPVRTAKNIVRIEESW